MLGFEASEPTGLFQYSGAYSSDTETIIDNDLIYSDIITPDTKNGVKVSYESDTDFFAISLQDGAFLGDGRLGSDTDNDALADLVAQLTGGVDPELNGYAIEATKFTLAHNYAFTNNLMLVAEISAIDYEFEGGEVCETLEGAFELLFTF
jgi:hypothetical protein